MMIVVLLLSGAVAFSQQNRFIFIQAGPQQPFYVRMGERSFSSSAFGHLVIPKLSDSTYKIYIGFPRNQVPEQEFSVTLNGKDRGFDLRMENTNQLVLFDWQKADLIRSTNPPAPTQEVSYKIKRRTDSYALLMAGVVNDSLVLVSIQEPEAPLVKSNTAKPALDSNNAVGQPVIKDPNPTNPVAANPNQQATEPNDTISNKNTTATVPSSVVSDDDKTPLPVTIRLYSEKTGPEEKQLVFIDGAGARADTINVVIFKEFETIVDSPPLRQEKEAVDEVAKAEKNASISQGKKDTLVESSNGKDAVSTEPGIQRAMRDSSGIEMPASEKANLDTVKRESRNDSTGNKDMTESIKETNVLKDSMGGKGENQGIMKDTIIAQKEPLYRPRDPVQPGKDSTANSIVLMNSDCTRFASELDVDKLRVLLIKEKEDDDRTFIAKKVFRTRCFTTRQIKGLTELFTGEASKYMFLDAAYPFVSDSGNFKTLIGLFSDPYYINRFKALVRM